MSAELDIKFVEALADRPDQIVTFYPSMKVAIATITDVKLYEINGQPTLTGKYEGSLAYITIRGDWLVMEADLPTE